MTNSETAFPRRRRPRTSTSKLSMVGLPLPSFLILYMLLSQSDLTNSFGLTNPSTRSSMIKTAAPLTTRSSSNVNKNRNSPTALNVWWFGGNEQNDGRGDDESCELVAVRIERPTSNSRKIAGELSIPGATVEDAWSILTDYDRLAIHIPNLRESRIVKENNGNSSEERNPGDGMYKCQLYQVGAQKIIGFDFSASVTMDMEERFLTSSTSNARKIHFKCAESQFFSAFDGSWTVQEQRNQVTGEKEVLCSYDVLVKPKGPVPVAALEWRIREDVPTNLRAVKAATLGKIAASSPSMELAMVGASVGVDDMAVTANGRSRSRNGRTNTMPVRVVANRGLKQRTKQLEAVMVDWERGETMAKYL